MSPILDILKPIQGKHSIKEAALSLFLSSSIIKPERFEKLIKSDFREEFQKFEPLSQISFEFRGSNTNETPDTSAQITENTGFKFVRFEDGKTHSALQGVNEPARTFIAYHLLDYTDWDVFLANFNRLANVLAAFHPNIFVRAFSLHYIDEFIWDSPDDIVSTDVFNTNSKLLPQEFFECKLNNYIFSSFKEKYLDRLEIKVDVQNGRKHIIISHNVILQLPDDEMLENIIVDDEFQKMFHVAHGYNKSTLLDILAKDVCKIIALKP